MLPGVLVPGARFESFPCCENLFSGRVREVVTAHDGFLRRAAHGAGHYMGTSVLPRPSPHVMLPTCSPTVPAETLQGGSLTGAPKPQKPGHGRSKVEPSDSTAAAQAT